MSATEGALGREYADGEPVCVQGEPGDCLYVIQSGTLVVVREDSGTETELAELKAGDILGEMSIFDKQPRSATVRAKGKAQVLTLDKRGFLRRVHEDPSLAFRILESMSHRIRTLNDEVERLRRTQS